MDTDYELMKDVQECRSLLGVSSKERRAEKTLNNSLKIFNEHPGEVEKEDVLSALDLVKRILKVCFIGGIVFFAVGKVAGIL